MRLLFPVAVSALSCRNYLCVYNTPPRVYALQVVVVLLQQLQLGETQSTFCIAIVVDVSVFTDMLIN